MAAKFICDCCGKEEDAVYGSDGTAHKPYDWWSHRPKPYAAAHACSRECRDKLPGTPAPF